MSAYSKQNGKIVKIKNFYIKQGNKILSAKELWTKVNNQMVKVYSALNPGIFILQPDYDTGVSQTANTIYQAEDDLWVLIEGNNWGRSDGYVANNSDLSDKVKLYDKNMFYYGTNYFTNGAMFPVRKGQYYQVTNQGYYKLKTLPGDSIINPMITQRFIDVTSGLSMELNKNYYAQEDIWLVFPSATTVNNLTESNLRIADNEDMSNAVDVSFFVAGCVCFPISKGLYWKITKHSGSLGMYYSCVEE